MDSDRASKEAEFCRGMLKRMHSIPLEALGSSSSCWPRQAWLLIIKLCIAHLKGTDTTAKEDAENYTSNEVTAFLNYSIAIFEGALQDFRNSSLKLVECERVINEYTAKFKDAQATWTEQKQLSFEEGQTGQAVEIIWNLFMTCYKLPEDLQAVKERDIETVVRMASEMGLDLSQA
ncbi:hypothetical protein G3M48_001452 [Beauveria asiatica]|uniref:Uncharacterized protein n=1 Tax=Beauveria asiatica TaxID=1069075 RepID=A0AAW0RZV4_9HYPO